MLLEQTTKQGADTRFRELSSGFDDCGNLPAASRKTNCLLRTNRLGSDLDEEHYSNQCLHQSQ